MWRERRGSKKGVKGTHPKISKGSKFKGGFFAPSHFPPLPLRGASKITPPLPFATRPKFFAPPLRDASEYPLFTT